MELKEVSVASANLVKKNQWEKQSKKPESSSKIKEVKQVRPTMDLLDRFEARRTDLEKRNAGPLRTIWGWYGTNKERIDAVLQHGFEKSMSGSAVVCWEDPDVASQFAEGKQMLLCRVALGTNGVDYDFEAATGKYSIKFPDQIMPTWFVSLN